LLSNIMGSVGIVKLLGIICSFGAVFFMLTFKRDLLPRDLGREYAVGGEKAKGKTQSAGAFFVPVFVICSLIFAPLSIENFIYLVLMLATMVTGYLDDAAAMPWGELKKGLFDLAIAVAAAVAYVYFNGSMVRLAIFGLDLSLPAPVYVVLAVVLIWVSINVTNCSDGVDGLSASLSIATMVSFVVFGQLMAYSPMSYHIALFAFCLLSYLWFNATPSIAMMGDAGSRAMGFFLAVIAMKSASPFMYIPFAIMLILDGGLGLIKVSLIRYLKINAMPNLRTPIHDHVRKETGWSNAQTVFRFVIVQALVSAIFICLI